MLLPFLSRIRVGSLKPPVTPGSQSFGYGSYAPVIPEYNSLTVEVWGAGGGGSNAASGGNNATAGGTSYFNAPSGVLYAYGGNPAYYAAPDPDSPAQSYPGSHGVATGGDVNTTGGGNPGGAGGSWNSFSGSYGGWGGYVKKTWLWNQAGAPVIGAQYSLVCGAGGAGANYPANGALNGYAGSNASARLTWS